MLKAGEDQLHERLYEVIKRIWEKERMPEDRTKVSLFPIFKKGDKLKCKNYRGYRCWKNAIKYLHKA